MPTSPEDKAKTQAEIGKIRLEQQFLKYQVSRSYRRTEMLKAIAGLGTVAAAIVGIVTLAISAAQWNVQLTQTRQVRIEERVDKALERLGDSSPSKRLGAVASLKSFLSQPDDVRHAQVLSSLTSALALEQEIEVRNAIIEVFKYINPSIVSKPVLNEALVSLAAISRSLVSANQLEDVSKRKSSHPKLMPDSHSAESRAQSVGSAITTFLRLGARNPDLNSIYCIQCDFSKIELSGVKFDDSILFLSNFSRAHLARSSFNRADVEGVSFVNANLQNAKLTAVRENRPGAGSPTYIFQRFRDDDSRSIEELDFSCADLRSVDFQGHPLFSFVFESQDSRYYDAPVYVSQPKFIKANLKGTDFSKIKQFGVIPTNSKSPQSIWNDRVRPPLGICGGVSVSRAKKDRFYELFEFDICQGDPVDNSSSESLKTSLFFLAENLRQTNWQDAIWPSILRAWLEKDPPPTELRSWAGSEKPVDCVPNFDN